VKKGISLSGKSQRYNYTEQLAAETSALTTKALRAAPTGFTLTIDETPEEGTRSREGVRRKINVVMGLKGEKELVLGVYFYTDSVDNAVSYSLFHTL
jgi:hypothetical protein